MDTDGSRKLIQEELAHGFQNSKDFRQTLAAMDIKAATDANGLHVHSLCQCDSDHLMCESKTLMVISGLVAQFVKTYLKRNVFVEGGHPLSRRH